MTALLLAYALLSSPAHSEPTWCQDTLNSGACKPTIIRCDYETPNRNPRCIGVGPAVVTSTVAEQRPHRKAPR